METIVDASLRTLGRNGHIISLRSFRLPAPAAAFAILFFPPQMVQAGVAPNENSELAQCIATASRGRPWLEHTLWGLRDQEGGRVGAEIANANGSHDLGPLQVNSWWVSKLAFATGRPAPHIRYWLANDACFNVDAAKWIFLSGLARARDYWTAIGVYHSPKAARQRSYVQAVATRMKLRFGSDIFRSSRSVWVKNRSHPYVSLRDRDE